jgi:dTDP-4-dehydrorhamnose reductase
MTEFGRELAAEQTPIPGLTLWQLPVHGDSRGWFKENWQRAKMTDAGLPDFGPVQQNIAFNEAAGTTRGIHAEPWDKFISVATGRVFGAWVDLRAGPTFGTVFTAELDPSRAVFVPRGVGNSYQTLEPGTVYTYLVNAHYSPDAGYVGVHPGDQQIAIDWPIPLDQAVMSDKDRVQPRLAEVEPFVGRRTLVVGADGQLGRALREAYAGDPTVEFAGRADLDLHSADLGSARPWRDYGTIINAAAYTAVDDAETADGRAAAWATNVTAVAALVNVAAAHGITLVHISSDYVFDGTGTRPHREDDPVTPLGVYGQTKAAADQVVSTLARHYILRTSWVIGDGRNFVRTMMSLADRGVNPSVVDDQWGRLTFTSELARAIRHLLDTRAPHGTYNVTGSGAVRSWAQIAKRSFELAGHDPERVTGVSTTAYFSNAKGPVAPRPSNSVLDLEKIESTGFRPADADDMLKDYVRSHIDRMARTD